MQSAFFTAAPFSAHAVVVRDSYTDASSFGSRRIDGRIRNNGGRNGGCLDARLHWRRCRRRGCRRRLRQRRQHEFLGRARFSCPVAPTGRILRIGDRAENDWIEFIRRNAYERLDGLVFVSEFDARHVADGHDAYRLSIT